MPRRLRVIGLALAALLVVLAATWAALAIGYRAPGAPAARALLVALWIAFALGVLVVLLRHDARCALGAFAVAFALVLVWWSGIAPSNTRAWADDVARPLRGHVDGDRVALDNVREFDWRSDTDYTVRWEARGYDLAQLASTDLLLSTWGHPSIAHMLVSFGFDDGRFLAFSVEIRREKGEAYSEIAGFFKQYELIVIAADERDIVRVRSNVRGEEVTLYRLALDARQRRALFLAYVAEANRLAATPAFYDTVTSNCTTLVYRLARPIVGHLPLDRSLLQTGYLPEYLERLGGLVPGVPLAELRARGRITDRARAADASATFSHDIRVGVPGLDAAR
ncbi:MAG: DUF4105 domain-containing protein [Xanthomonadales bacterium]|nr:DUF4105 domain-containing protein [Xanthomonadales bacterium]